jgi:hypothetical protein
MTLDEMLLDGIETFTNGCNFTLRFEGPRTFLEYGCYGVHLNLAQGAERELMQWLDGSGPRGRGKERELVGVHPETVAKLKMRKPCQCCGGFLFKAA